MKRSLFIAAISFTGTFSAAAAQPEESIKQYLTSMYSQCKSCAIALQDYGKMKQQYCDKKITVEYLRDTFASSPMITGMLAVYSIDPATYKYQYLPVAKEKMDCKSDKAWFKATSQAVIEQVKSRGPDA